MKSGAAAEKNSLLLATRNAAAFFVIFCLWGATHVALLSNAAAASSSIERLSPSALLGHPGASRTRISVRLGEEDLADVEAVASSTARSKPVFLGLIKDDGGIDDQFLAQVTADIAPEVPLNQQVDEYEDFVEDEALRSSSSDDAPKLKDGYAKILKFDTCPPKWSDYIPCLDNVQAIRRLPSTARGEQYERHCPTSKGTRMCCLIAAPEDWKTPIKWPRSRAEVRTDACTSPPGLFPEFCWNDSSSLCAILTKLWMCNERCGTATSRTHGWSLTREARTGSPLSKTNLCFLAVELSLHMVQMSTWTKWQK